MGKCPQSKTFPFFLVVNTSALSTSPSRASQPSISDAANLEDRNQDHETTETTQDKDECQCTRGYVYDPYNVSMCGVTCFCFDQLLFRYTR
jgi:hypothetical protein